MILLDADIMVKSEKWHAEDNIEDIVAEICANIMPLTDLNDLSQDDLDVELSVSLVCDEQIREINAEFRDKKQATNVLSFPSLDETLIRAEGLQNALGENEYVFLGDIVIAYETMKKESLAQNKKFCDHLTHIILHSILHLLGYDHEEDKMADKMESLEINILQQMGIINPYIN